MFKVAEHRDRKFCPPPILPLSTWVPRLWSNRCDYCRGALYVLVSHVAFHLKFYFKNFIPISTGTKFYSRFYSARACESLLSVNRARPMMDCVFFSLSVNDQASSTNDELCVLLCDSRERSDVDDQPMVDYMYFYNY